MASLRGRAAVVHGGGRGRPHPPPRTSSQLFHGRPPRLTSSSAADLVFTACPHSSTPPQPASATAGLLRHSRLLPRLASCSSAADLHGRSPSSIRPTTVAGLYLRAGLLHLNFPVSYSSMAILLPLRPSSSIAGLVLAAGLHLNDRPPTTPPHDRLHTLPWPPFCAASLHGGSGTPLSPPRPAVEVSKRGDWREDGSGWLRMRKSAAVRISGRRPTSSTTFSGSRPRSWPAFAPVSSPADRRGWPSPRRPLSAAEERGLILEVSQRPAAEEHSREDQPRNDAGRPRR